MALRVNRATTSLAAKYLENRSLIDSNAEILTVFCSICAFNSALSAFNSSLSPLILKSNFSKSSKRFETWLLYDDRLFLGLGFALFQRIFNAALD